MKISELIIYTAQQFNDYDPDGADDDAKYTQVTLAQWIEYYNAAQRRLVLVRPDSHYKYEPFQLTANAVKHTLPDESRQLIDIPYNLGTGSTPGDSIFKALEGDIKAMDPLWHTMTGEASIDHYAYDKKVPDTIWTYPKAHATTDVYVMLAYSYPFTDAVIDTIDSTDIEAEEIYFDSLQEWMLKLAYEVDSDSANNISLSLKYEASFYKGLGIEFSSSTAISPKPGGK